MIRSVRVMSVRLQPSREAALPLPGGMKIDRVDYGMGATQNAGRGLITGIAFKYS
jgi:hypothetical protein